MQFIPIAELRPHPNNTAPYCPKYRCNVYADRVEQLVKLIELNGYDSNYPIVARYMVGSGKPFYEVVEGNHRLMAVLELYQRTGFPKWQTVPVVVKDMTDREVAIAQITRQGRPISTIIHADHLYRILGEFGEDRASYLQQTSEYALYCGLTLRNVRGLYRIGQVNNHLRQTMNPKHYELLEDRLSPYLLEEIAQLPTQQWAWFALYFLRNKTSFTNAREMILKVKYATAEIDYENISPQQLHKLLDEIVTSDGSNLDVLRAWCNRQPLHPFTAYPQNKECSDNDTGDTAVAEKTDFGEKHNHGYYVGEVERLNVNKLHCKAVCVAKNIKTWHCNGERCLVMIINDLIKDNQYNEVEVFGERPDMVIKRYIVTTKKICSPQSAKLVTLIYDKSVKIEGVTPTKMTDIDTVELGGLLLSILKALKSTDYYLLAD